MDAPRVLDTGKSFVCLAYGCAIGTVRVPKGTQAGTVVKHDCGMQAILAYDGDSWLLMPVDAQDAPTVVGTLTAPNSLDEEEKMESVEAPKRKRGRPPKNQSAGVSTPQVIPAEKAEFTKEFVKEAMASDRRIDKFLDSGNSNFYGAITELVQSGEKGYYKALGYKTFDKYREAKTQYSRSHIGQGLQVYRAMHGKIPDEKFMALPMPTAVLLTKIPESKLTEELVDEVKELTIQEFKEKKYLELTGQLVDADGKPQPVPEEEFAWVPRIRAHSQVVDRWKRLMAVARWKAQGLVDEHDVYSNFTLDEKALIAICVECLNSSGWDAEFSEAVQKANTPVAENSEAAF